MKLTLMTSLVLLLIACGSKSSGLSNSQETKPSPSKRNQVNDVSFSFDSPTFDLKQGSHLELKARLTNHKSTSVHVGNWSSLSPRYYWQSGGVITASYLPHEYRRLERGRGIILASPAVLWAQFRELKPNESIEVPIKIPPTNSQEMQLERGKWRIKLQHIWIEDYARFKPLLGQELLDTLKTEGHIVWAYADVIVE